jgi:hypothetical protein
MEEEISLRQASLPGMADLARHRPFPVPRFITQAVAVVIMQAMQLQPIEVTEELAEEDLAVQRWWEALPLLMQKVALPTVAAVVVADKNTNLMPVQAVPAS